MEEIEKDKRYDHLFTEVTMIQGDKKRKIKAPTLTLLLLDKTYESFEGYEKFIKDFMKGYDDILVSSNDLCKIHTSIRFNKHIYIIDNMNEFIETMDDYISPLVEEFLYNSICDYGIHKLSITAFLNLSEEIMKKLVNRDKGIFVEDEEVINVAEDDVGILSIEDLYKLCTILILVGTEFSYILHAMKIGEEYKVYISSQRTLNINIPNLDNKHYNYQFTCNPNSEFLFGGGYNIKCIH